MAVGAAIQNAVQTDAARVDKALSPEAVGKAITGQTGIAAPSGPLIYSDGYFGDYYIAKGISSEQKVRVEAALVALLKGNGEVAEVYTRAQIAETPMPTGSPQDWTLLQRARASFDPARSGDVLSLLRRGLARLRRGFARLRRARAALRRVITRAHGMRAAHARIPCSELVSKLNRISARGQAGPVGPPPPPPPPLRVFPRR